MDIRDLFSNLHENPEFSGKEKKTTAILKKYLEENTDLVLKDLGTFFYGIHDEGAERTIAIRADIDAIHRSNGNAYHGCGHDGHASMAAEAARLISGKKIGKNVIFLFQPAEENGEGAKTCFPLFEHENIDLILGLHNIPGYPLGEILLTKETFADASLGLTLSLSGAQSHAGCPEEGTNPGFAISDLVCKLSDIEKYSIYEKPVLSTLICVDVGEPNFGINAGNGELCLTLRARTTKDLAVFTNTVIEEMKKSIEKCYSEEQRQNITLETKIQDEFPATENNPKEAEHIYETLKSLGFRTRFLDKPMRWSEDFGNYRSRCKSFFFGLGSGENHPGLHTEEYVFPTELLEKGAETWVEIIKAI